MSRNLHCYSTLPCVCLDSSVALKSVHFLTQVKAVASAGHSPCRRPAVITCGSIICHSSFTIPHQRENTTTAASPSTTNAHTLTHVSIKLIFEQGTGFISETNGVLLTNTDSRVSLIHLPCYSSRHFNPVIVIPEGNKNDIRVTNIIFPSVHQPGEIMESNGQVPL